MPETVTEAFESPNLVYAEARDGFIAQVGALSAEQVQSVVPACPAWTVRDVLAHLSGLVAEALANVPGSLGSDEATSRQVADRSAMTAAEICAEWAGNAEAFDALAQIDRDRCVNLVGDLAIHIHDVSEGLELPIDRTSAATLMAANRYIERLQERVAETMGAGLSVTLTDGQHWPASDAALTLTTTAFDFLRHVSGRRSRADVLALQWSDDPTDLVDRAWVQYGGKLR